MSFLFKFLTDPKRQPEASLTNENFYLAHINHVRDIAGVESVGIGASYDGINA